MAEGISRDEMLALQEALTQGRIDAGPATATRARVRQYDFAVPDKFSKDLLRSLQHLHDGMARALTTSLSAHVRGMIQVDSPVMAQQTYQRFVSEVPDPSVLAAFSAEPLAGTAVCEIDVQIAFPIIDRLLGGPGQALQETRALTEIEMTVIQRVVLVVLGQWREAWAHAADLRPSLLTLETNPLFLQLAAPNDIVLTVSFGLHLGGHEGSMRLCLPFGLLEPTLPQLARRNWAQGAARHGPGRHDQVARILQATPVPLRVELARSRATVSQVMALRPGDVLPLSAPVGGPATLFVRDEPKFLGRIGRIGRRLAIEIEGRLGGDPQ